jgi:hypothetical protein
VCVCICVTESVLTVCLYLCFRKNTRFYFSEVDESPSELDKGKLKAEAAALAKVAG